LIEHFTYLLSITSYTKLFWGTDTKEVLYVQNKIIQLMTSSKRKVSCEGNIWKV